MLVVHHNNQVLEFVIADGIVNRLPICICIGGRQLTNLRFADDIEGLAGSGIELRQLVAE